MKRLFLVFSVALFTACGSPVVTPKHLPDTVFTSVIFQNPFAGVYPLPTFPTTAQRIVRDSIKINGDHVTHSVDTFYRILFTYTLPDPKDSTHRKALKTNSGDDSTVSFYQPFDKKYIIVDFNTLQPYPHP